MCTFSRLPEEDAELYNVFTHQRSEWRDTEVTLAGTCAHEVRFEEITTPLLGSFEIAPPPPTP